MRTTTLLYWNLLLNTLYMRPIASHRGAESTPPGPQYERPRWRHLYETNAPSNPEGRTPTEIRDDVGVRWTSDVWQKLRSENLGKRDPHFAVDNERRTSGGNQWKKCNQVTGHGGWPLTRWPGLESILKMTNTDTKFKWWRVWKTQIRTQYCCSPAN